MRNRLADETSPYLLQHKDNPVHWQAWGDAALRAAQGEGRPILLSVGYAACHWCHVMAHESFEDPVTAALMNDLFVNIKVDREERPDLDFIYQQALALLGQPGGWPLTMFLTPAGEPFWGGTYFPPTARYGRPGFPDVLRQIAHIYRDEPAKVTQNVGQLREAMAGLAAPSAGGTIAPDALDRIALRLLEEVDGERGGIGGAPKFPQTPILALLWRAWKRSGNRDCREAVTLTLTRMAQGGIYDHLGGGFARYATDAAWLVPHFEKMLYDNAQLLELLVAAWQETAEPLYEQRVRETVGWVLREMRATPGPGGQRGFASALDADSEGEEGRFYVWRKPEIDALLGPDAAAFAAAYDVTPTGNWEGNVILNRSARPVLGSPHEEAHLAVGRAILLAARSSRVRPGWDDKVLADWNGLMIAALAEAGAVFAEPAWIAAARDAFAFVGMAMVADGRLRHSWRQGRARHPALLDDYANLSRAALVLHEAMGDPACLAQAEAWAELVERHFADPAAGGHYLTADDTADVILRPRSAADQATPAGNGTMVEVLARLHYLTGREIYRERAEATIAAFAGEAMQNPFSHATLLNAAELLWSAVQIVIIGRREAADTQALLRVVRAHSLPNRVLQVVTAGEALPAAHPAAGKPAVGGRATAYLCRGPTCSLPIADPATLDEALAHG
jgi:uncharacterized protein